MQSATPAAGFFDAFLYALLLLCTCASLVDWLIGKRNRERLREAVGHWWVRVQDSALGESFQHDARMARGIHRWYFDLDDSYGSQKLGQFVRMVWLLLLALFAYVTFALYWRLSSGAAPVPIEPGQQCYSRHGAILALLAGFPLGFLSIRVVDRVLDKITSPASRRVAIAAVFQGLALMGFLIGSALLLVLIANFYELHIRPLYHTNINPACLRIITIQPALLNGQSFRIAWDVASVAALMALLPSSISVLSLVFAQSLFFVCKLFRFVLKPILAVVLLRFAEAEKGVLTTLALAGSALAKLVQESLKYW